MIWTPDLLFSKPPRGSRLNPSHPLSRGLSEGWLVNEGTGPVYGLKHPGWCSKMEGGYWQGNNLHSAAGGGNAITWGGDEYTAVPCLSLAVGAKIHAMDSTFNMEQLVLITGQDTPGISYIYDRDSSSYVLAGNWGEKAYAITFSSSTPDLLGQYLQIVLVYGPGGYPFLYVNGEIPSDMVSDSTGPFSPPTISLHKLVLLGFPSANLISQGHKELYYCYMWDRSLTEAEVKMLWRDPYCMVRRQPTDIGAFEYVQGGGGTTYTQSLTGELPYPSGSLLYSVAFFTPLTGDLPSPAGGVAKHISKPLAGDFPSVFGEAGKQTNKQLSGIPPSPSGSVVKHTDKHLLGDIPSGAGVIIPSSDIAQSVYGELPSPSGGAIKHTAKQLSGASPSPTGDSTKHISTTLRGEAPAPSGTPNQAYRTSQSTSGIMGLIFGAISSILNPIVSLRSAAGIIGSRLKRFIGG